MASRPLSPGRRPPAVAASGLVLAHGARIALAASDLTLPGGATTALVGPNGSGKSTLLRAVAGLLRPRQGTLAVGGEPPARARRRVRYVPQAVQANGRLPVTVREAVAMGRYAERGAFRRLAASDREAVAAALERLGVAALASRHLGELSGGQRQRVLVAQGLAQDGDLLLLDEPLAGLDLPSQQRIAAVVDEERRAGRSVVTATHDLAEAARSDHVVLLAGRVVAEGPPAAVLTAANLAAAYGAQLLRVDGGVVLLDDAGHSHPAPHGAPPGRRG